MGCVKKEYRIYSSVFGIRTTLIITDVIMGVLAMKTGRQDNIQKLLSERENFLVIAMTGRVGSGCSQTADILASDVDEIALPRVCREQGREWDNNDRDRRMLYEYYKCHWVPFDVIRVRTVIATFLLDDMNSFAGEVLRIRVDEKGKPIYSNIREVLKKLSRELKKQLNKNTDDQYDDEAFEDVKKILGKNGIDTDAWKKFCRMAKKAYDKLGIKKADYKKLYEECIGFVADNKVLFDELYKKTLYGVDYAERNRYLKAANKCVYIFSAVAAYAWICAIEEDKNKDIWRELAGISKRINQNNGFESFVFVHDLMPTAATVIHDELSGKESSKKESPNRKSDIFTKLFLKYGNSIRKYGRILYNNEAADSDSDIFEIPRKINSFIKVLRHPFGEEASRPERVVIDALKNPFEAIYLRGRYSAFYMFSISMDDKKRREGLRFRRGLDDTKINFIDWNEYSKEGYDILEKYTRGSDSLSEDEIQFAKIVNNEDNKVNDVLFDRVRMESYKNQTYPFILQDVGNCIQNADVFISDKGKKDMLKWEVIRNVCLMLYPGLVQPTPIERCMQIAFSAKVNSGCISRQVGAVVADAGYNILSIGWNDVPCGDISCSRKNVIDLCNKCDKDAYTKYELEDKSFRDRIEQIYQKMAGNPGQNVAKGKRPARLFGLPMRYCFKDVSSDVRSPMKSRARHGEEMALSKCGKECEGGYLFTTSSPCEMCAKNAKDHKIKTIYYIEPYPSMSEAQYSKSGSEDNRAEHVLFTGAVGRAYTQMYTPLMPHKDLLEHLTDD